MKALALHLIWVKKLLTCGTLVANLHKLPQIKWMIHVFVRTHSNTIAMESPQAKPTKLVTKKVGLSKLTWALG
jgi:hypothetical protein